MSASIERNSGGIPVRPFGKTGEMVSILGFGGGHCARKHLSEQQTVRIIQRAVDEGITFMDNAWEYHGGESERRMGIALEGRRDQVFLMTKVCGRDSQSALQQLEESLRRLGTDQIDLWQFHEVNYDNDPEWIFRTGGAIEAALAAREQGKVRFIGFTGHKSPDILRKMFGMDFQWDACQMPVNVLDAHYRSFQRQLLPTAADRNVAVIGMKSLGGEGQLVTAAGLTAQQCRRYAMSLPITTLVAGIESMENLDQDLEIARSFEPMTESEMEALADQVREVATDGRYEWFKSTQYFDSKTHREQHGFPPVSTVN